MARLHCVFIALAACCTLAAAEVLGPGDVVAGPTGTTASAAPGLRGKLVENVVTHFSYAGELTDASTQPPTTFRGDVSGTVRTRVILAADGTYDFYWQVTVDRRSFLPVARLEITGPSPGTYDAAWLDGPRPGSVSPAYVAQDDSGDVTWAFGQYVPPSMLIHPGQTTHYLLLDSDATAYERATMSLVSEDDGGGSMLVQWGGASGPLATFGPAVGAGLHGAGSAPEAVAARHLKQDPFLRQLGPGIQRCIISRIAQQHARFAPYGPRGGPFDEAAIRAAAGSFASGCPGDRKRP